MITAADVMREVAERYGDDFGPQQVADTYESMQAAAARKKGGVYYTPQPVAAFLSRFSLDIALTNQVGPKADQVLRIVALDPACGTGIILVEAAQYLATQYAGRLVGQNPTQELVDAVLPTVVLSCVFGIELDPVAAELTRICVSRTTGGLLTPAQLERHIVAGDTLAGVMPPALEERRQVVPVGGA